MTRLAPTPETRATFLRAKAMLLTTGYDPASPAHWTVLGKAIGAVCRIRDCENPSMAFGMCNAHYHRHNRAVANEAATINYRATRRAA